MAIGNSSPSASCSSTADFTAIVDAAIVSPSTMIVNRPNRSETWCGCQEVAKSFSAYAGTHISAIAITRNTQGRPGSGSTSSPSQPTWHSSTPPAYRSAMVLSGPFVPRATRSHWAINANRMIT